ncbi:hypothetical protein D210916BOD24_14800 [Alteromonas sp. D210916BOD_24]|uniref:substrate-binding periplasmic protein n=1 Tax=Alteromonas sp. D210916BOD_24 TaxID=3157618 RepID=UPI00399C7EBE
MYKRIKYSLLFFVIFSTNTSPSYYSKQGTDLNNCKEVIISAHPNYAPFHWVENGNLIGASIEVSGQILDEMGVPWRAVYVGPWKRVLQQAYMGNVDLIPALKKTTERSQFLHFTQAEFYSNPVAVFKKNNEHSQPINSLGALDGLVGSINTGDSHGEQIDAFLSVQSIVQVKGLAENFKMLSLGRTDYFVIGKQTARSYLERSGQVNDFVSVFEVTNSVVHHAFSQRSDCLFLLEEFDKRLRDKVNLGEVNNAIERYKIKWLDSKLRNE